LAQLSNFARLRCAFVTSFYGAEAAKFRGKWTGNQKPYRRVHRLPRNQPGICHLSLAF
jgi:hypothetical protein